MPSQTVTAIHPRRYERHHRPPGGHGRAVRARAPLRLGLAGGGTDVSPYCDEYGGIVLNTTIDRYCYATIESRTDGRAEFHAPDLEISEEEDEEGACDLPLHAASYRRLCAEYGLGRPALTITTVADAPAGSGLGSSSTLVVSIIEAFREFFSLPLGEYDVAQLAFDIERNDCGLQGGRQDQFAATFGGFNVMEFSRDRAVVNPLRLKPAIVQELEASLLLYHTGVSRASSGIIREQTMHVRAGDANRIEATHALKRESIALKEALLMGDLCTVASVINSGWEVKKLLANGISTPDIDGAFEVARSAGALAGKVSGAGGGGYIMFLVEPTARPAVVAALGRGSVEPVHFVTEGAVAWTLR